MILDNGIWKITLQVNDERAKSEVRSLKSEI